MIRTLITLLACFIAACAPRPSLRPIPADHPAHPDAAVAVLPPAADAETPAREPEVSGAYQCPMHPAVRSDDPTATCPTCGMLIDQPIPTEGAR